MFAPKQRHNNQVFCVHSHASHIKNNNFLPGCRGMPSAQELSLLEGSASRSAVYTSVQAEENLEEGVSDENEVGVC